MLYSLHLPLPSLPRHNARLWIGEQYEKDRWGFVSLSWILALGLLAGCSGEPAARKAADDPRVTAGAVPVVAAQALTLRFGLGSEVNLQEVGDQDAASLLVEDVDGYPLVYLTVLGPEARGGFWEAARAAVSAGEGHYLVTTGASTLYSPTLFADTGTDTLEHLLSVADALGGPEAVARVVGFADPGRYYLADREGRFYDGCTGEAVSEDEVAQLAEDFHGTVERLAEEDDYRAEMAHVWACLLGKASEEECNTEDASAEALEARQAEAELLSRLGYDPVSVQGMEVRPLEAGMGLAGMTGADGELDFAKAQRVVSESRVLTFSDSGQVKPQYSAERCVNWLCFGKYWIVEARDGRTRKPEYDYIGQNWQYRWEYDFNTRETDADLDNFTLYALHGHGKVGDRPIGCAPAAFIRLVTWFQFERRGYTGGANIDWYGDHLSVGYGSGTESGTGAKMYERNKALGHRMLALKRYVDGSGNSRVVYYRPKLTEYMRTRAFMGSGLTLVGDFVKGANRWLAERGSPLRVRGGGYVFMVNLVPYLGWAAWNGEVWKMYSAALGVMGTRNEPAIAIYVVGGGGYHYSPVLEARLYNWRVKADVLVRAPENEGFPVSGKFVNISAFKLTAGGLYGLW